MYVSFCLTRQHNALQVSLIKNSKLRRQNTKAPTRILQVCLSLARACLVLCCQCSIRRRCLSYVMLPVLSLALLILRPVYRKAISPPARCLWCRNAWLPQKRRKTCFFHLLLACCALCLALIRTSFCEVFQRTPYTTTAPKTAAATPLPSLGSSDEPMTVWCPLANMLPMVLRIMMAKMEMTTLLGGAKSADVPFRVDVPCYFSLYCILLIALLLCIGSAYHVHALKAETTGFIVVVWLCDEYGADSWCCRPYRVLY